MENVTVDRLFRVHKQVELLGRKLSVRCLSGPETQDRERYSLLAGLRVENKLRDTNSEEYQSTLFGIKNLEKEGLIGFLLVNYAQEARDKAVEKFPAIYQPFPDGALEAEQRAVLQAREDSETTRIKKIDAEIEALLKLRQTDLEDTPLDQLIKKVESQAIARSISQATNEAYAYYALYLSVCDENGKRYFSTPEEVYGMPDSVVFSLMRDFKEINNLDPLAWSGPSSTASPATSGVSSVKATPPSGTATSETAPGGGAG